MLLANILLDTFEKGGPIMWPLLLVMLAGLFVILERTLWWVRITRSWHSPKLEAAIAALRAGDNAKAAELAQGEDCPGLALVAEAVAHPREVVVNALQLSAAKQLAAADRLVWLLGTVITIAPLFGLLGTVIGIMSSFNFVGDAELAAAKVSGGIAEALIATAYGLGIAIVAVIPFNLFRRRVADLRHRLEFTANRIELALALAAQAPVQNAEDKTQKGDR